MVLKGSSFFLGVGLNSCQKWGSFSLGAPASSPETRDGSINVPLGLSLPRSPLLPPTTYPAPHCLWSLLLPFPWSSDAHHPHLSLVMTFSLANVPWSTDTPWLEASSVLSPNPPLASLPLLCYRLLFSSCSVMSFCDSMSCSTPGSPVLHHLLEFAQTHIHWVDVAIQPSHPLLPPSFPDLNLSQDQPSLWSNSHICTWLLEKQYLWLYRHL